MDTVMQPPLVILRREYLELVKDYCAAKVIAVFEHWRNYKRKRKMEEWIPMSVRQLVEELLGEHGKSKVRQALEKLEEMGILEKRRNPYNGQDRAYQYKLCIDRFKHNDQDDDAEPEIAEETLEVQNQHSIDQNQTSIVQNQTNINTDTKTASSTVSSTAKTEKPILKNSEPRTASSVKPVGEPPEWTKISLPHYFLWLNHKEDPDRTARAIDLNPAFNHLEVVNGEIREIPF